MKVLIRFCLLSFLFIFFRCVSEDKIPLNLKKEYPEALTISVKNELSLLRDDATVMLNIIKIKEKSPVFNEKAFVVWCDSEELPSQAIDSDGDGRLDQIIVISDFKPKEQKILRLLYIQIGEKRREYPKRTHAELSKKAGGHFEDKLYVGGEFQPVSCEKVPQVHVDHDTYYRFEGPGWESDKVGYRFYLDQRNRIDIFGKKVTQMVLPNVGLDGFDSYHEMSDWGADIFKVGESLGIGSIGTFFNDAVQQIYETDSIHFKILSDGPVLAEMQTKYYGWKVDGRNYDLQSNLSIHAGSRLTKHKVKVSDGLENLVTGLVKTEGCDFIRGDFQTNSKWSYIALWGKQSLMGDNLGTALFYKSADLIEIAEDELNHLVILKPEAGELKYYFAAAWEGEPDGVKTRTEFVDYLDQTVQELNVPIKVIY